MKKTLLTSLFCAAIACSSINFNPQSKETFKNAKNENVTALLAEDNNNNQNPSLPRLKTKFSRREGNITYDVDENNGSNDNTPITPNEIAPYYGEMRGDLFRGGGSVMDEDWFSLEVEERLTFTFKIESSDKYFSFDVYRYIGTDINSYSRTVPAYMCGSTRYTRQEKADMLPGTYFIRVFSDTVHTFESDNSYTVKYSCEFVPSISINNISEYTDPLNNGYEVFLWENDLIPFNANRWGNGAQQLYAERNLNPNNGYLDPVFKRKFNGITGNAERVFDGLDSIIYIFDKSAIQEIADNCLKLYEYLDSVVEYNRTVVEKDRITCLEAKNAWSTVSNVTGVISLGVSIVAMCVPGGQPLGIALSGVSLGFSSLSLGSSFVGSFLPDDNGIKLENYGYLYQNLTVLYENCITALNDSSNNQGIKLERYSSLYNKWSPSGYDNTFYYSVSAFRKTETSVGPNNHLNHYLVDKSESIDTFNEFVNNKGSTKVCEGRIYCFKDMDDFSSKRNFSLINDLPQGESNANVVPKTKTIKSIELKGSYKTTYLAGDHFSTNGMMVRVNYSDRTCSSIGVNYSIGGSAPSGIYVNLDKVNMNKEGRYPVLISYTQTLYGEVDTQHEYPYYITKYAYYYISVRWERETKLAHASLSVSGRDFTYFPGGHGRDAFYYLDTEIPLPFEDTSDIENVVYAGVQQTSGYLQIDTENCRAYFNGEMLSVHLEAFGVGQANVDVMFFYDVPVPFEERPELESISLSGDYQTRIKLGQDTYNANGLIVTATYSDGTTADVTEDCSIDCSEVNTRFIGEYPVYISYQERNISRSLTYHVSVEFAYLYSISLSGDYQTTFELGDPFNSDNLAVYANNSFEESILLNEGQYTLDSSNYNPYCAGTYQIMVSYTENNITKTTSYFVEVVIPELASVQLIGNFRDTFEVGEAFTSEGLEVVATYANGYAVNVFDFEVDASEVDMNTPGFYEVFVSYSINGIDGIVSYIIDVDEVCLESISLSGSPRTSFAVGETFNYLGLVVTANYSNGTFRTVSNYQVDASAVNMNLPGRYTVYITYCENGIEVSASYTIRVKRAAGYERTLDSISLSGNFRLIYRAGQKLNTVGLVVTANYRDGTSAKVADYKVDDSDVNMSAPGTYTVRIIYTEGGITKIAAYDIFVLEKFAKEINKDTGVEIEEPIFRP